MKKTILFIAALATWFGADAFAVRNHATVAYIAEQHLSSKAQKRVKEIFHGENLVDYASWPDYYRLSMLYENGKQVQHMVMVDESFHAADTTPDKSAYNAILSSADLLKNHFDELSDSARITNLSIIVHLIGDIHCPSHFKYADKRNKKVKTVNFQTYGKGKPTKIKYHSYWDNFNTDYIFCGGFLDIAAMLDTYSKKQIKEIQKGTLADWVYDNAMCCKDVYDIEDNKSIDRRDVVNDAQLAKSQIRKGGYRLAKFLNDLFK